MRRATDSCGVRRCRKTFVEIERYRKGLAHRTPKVQQVEETEPVAVDAEDEVTPPVDLLAHLKQVSQMQYSWCFG